ncbi:MAG TPA: BACON domain-containing carbohydrate-binding protein, partial [Candidatus Syntrophosphaera sp.]|nr:BACON domain-containing carbohydrate-binding protein [Candidatus Syntrophosphaera sp.]
DITPDSCDFGTIYDGQDVSQAFIVSNLGGGTLTLTDITLSGSLYFAFSAPPVLPVVLTALDSYEFSVVFTPLGAGDYTASLILTDDLSDAVYGGRNVHTVALSGSSLGVMYVEILPDSLLVGSSAGNVALNVSSNIVWNVTDNADWIDCTPGSGSGDGQVTVSYLANDSTDPRVGTISFMGLDDTVYDTVAVVQGGIPYLAVTPDSMTVTPEAGVVSVDLQSNVSWNASWTEDWIVSCTPASGVGSAIVSLAYVANTTNDPRSAVIFFFGPAGSGLASPFVLNQSAIPFLAITPDNANVAHEAGVLSLNVEANLDWTVGEAEDWIVCSPNSGSGDGVINVSYDANPDDSLRVGIITVSGPGGDPSVPFILTQNPAPYLIVTPDSLTVAAEGGDLTLELSSNVAWTVTADTDWISCLPTSGTGDSSITVTYMANTSSEPRQGHVTIQILGGGMSDSFTLFQQGVVTVDDDVQVPATTSLLGIYPNPFRGNTKIKYALANAAPYSLYVYNIRGDRVRNLKSGVGQPGLYMVAWDGRDERGTLVGSGIYYLVLRSGSQLFSRRLTLLK